MNSNNSSDITDLDLYKLLGITTNASQDEIKKAYRKAALSAHPDKGGSEELFKKISYAYFVLGSDEKRSEYDENYNGTAETIISGI